MTDRDAKLDKHVLPPAAAGENETGYQNLLKIASARSWMAFIITRGWTRNSWQATPRA